jgi:hypothetical protein
VVYLLDVYGHARGQTFDYRDEGATVGFAGCGEAEHWFFGNRAFTAETQRTQRGR